MKKWIGALLAAPLLLTTAMAAEPGVVSDTAKARFETLLSKGGGTLHYFPGPNGMVGIGVSLPNGKQMVMYGTPDGSVLFSGVAIDTATGDSLTRKDLERLPAPDLSGLAKHAKAARAISFGETDAKTEFYVFIDPNCPYCHKTFALFEQLRAEGKPFSVHYIPVGILGPRSENAAKAMLGLAGAAAEEALKAYMSQAGGTMLAEEAIAAGDKAHQSNLAIFRNLQFQAVPVTVVVRGDDVDIRNGLPEAEALRADIAGRPKVASK